MFADVLFVVSCILFALTLIYWKYESEQPTISKIYREAEWHAVIRDRWKQHKFYK